MAMTSYRIISDRRVLEHEPGTVFKADLSPQQEATLIASGHLEKIPAKRAERGIDKPGSQASD